MSDPAGIADPFVDDHAQVVAALAGARVGISLAQRFSDYGGHRFDFPGLAALGSFELPSRVVQYAATGLPALSIDPSGTSSALPEMVVARDRDALVADLQRLLADTDGLAELGRRTRERFERRLSAERRAELLERLLEDPEGWRGLTVPERATLWHADDPGPDPAAPAPRRRAPAAAARPAVVVAGYYGAGNVGDELILRVIADRLQAAGGGLQVVVAAQRPAEVARLHGLAAFARTDVPLAEAVVRSSSALVVGGGGLLHDLAFARAGGLAGLFSEPAVSVQGWGPLVVLAEILGVPVHLFGLGVGPLEDADARRLTAWLAARANSVSVRDRHSRELLERLPGGRAVVELAPDPVYALDLGAAEAPPDVARLAAGRRTLAVSVRRWDGAGGAGLTARLAPAVAAVARRHGLAVLGVPMQAGDAHDKRALDALLARLPDDVPSVTLPWTADQATLAAVLRGSAVTLAMRLHAGLLAHRVGTPCVGLGYDAKVMAHFEELDRASRCLALDAPAAAVERALEAALAEPRGGWEARLHELERDARAGLDRLADRVAGAALSPARLPASVTVPER